MSLTAFLDPAYAADLDALEELQRRKARDFGAECRTLVSLYRQTSGFGWQGSAPTDSMLIEVAGTCPIGQGTAGTRLSEALRLVQDLPGLMAALEAGRVFVPQAKVLLEETRNCSPEVCAQVEARVLAAAAELPPGRLRTKVRAAVLTVDAEEVARREAAATADRGLSIRAIEDGQALLIAKGPAIALAQLMQRLTAHAKKMIAAGDPRTIDQLRFHLLTEHNNAAAGAKAVTALIHVPVATGLGLADAPAVLEGYGPLSAATTRELLTEATLVKVCVDSITGRLLGTDQKMQPTPNGSPAALRKALLDMVITPTSVDHSPQPQHDPTAALVREINLRDRGCDGVGCSVPASQCENDHHIPWPAGATSFDNLVNRSQRCHHAKHHGWTVTTDPDGTSHWTSPAGRTYTVPSRDRPPPTIPTSARLTTPRELAARDAQLLTPPCPSCTTTPCDGACLPDAASDAA